MASVAQVWVNDASKLYYKNDINLKKHEKRIL